MQKTTNILLGAVLVLVVINLTLTSILFMRQPHQADFPAQESASLDADIARTWGRRVVELYNRQDHEGLYALFDEKARVKISYQQLKQQLEKLHELFGDIEQTAFVNSARIGKIGSEYYYQLLFNVRVKRSGKGAATLKITVIDDNQTISLFGVRINASQDLD